MRRDDRSPSSYLDSVDGELKDLLVEIRSLIFKVHPQCEELIEYGMLGYPGLANLAAQKGYVSLYVSPEALAKYKKQYACADCGKSCLRFKSMKDFDESAITYLLELVKKTT
ncbi:MAG: DUF1801 domain-containing protein [Planctomycetota bacterium]|jgi:uncharacterized protein YdhG (YjbR/CyaY superfamily)